jgi:hypothetical protein
MGNAGVAGNHVPAAARISRHPKGEAMTIKRGVVRTTLNDLELYEDATDTSLAPLFEAEKFSWSDPVVILPAETWDQRERERAEMVRLLRETVDEDSGLYVSIAITKFLSTLPSEEM